MKVRCVAVLAVATISFTRSSKEPKRNHKYHVDGIFLHIPKTAGVSINKALGRHALHPRHGGASVAIDLYGQEAWDNAFTFCFVRNPWDRMVSWHHFRKSKGHKNPRLAHQTLEEMLIEFQTHSYIKYHWYTPSDPQCNWIDIDGEQVVDFIGRFENLHEDFGKICEKLEATNVKLKHHNKSKRKHYAQYYTKETRDMVAEMYLKDIERFGYTFE